MYGHVASHGRKYHKYKEGSKVWTPDDGMLLILFENICFLMTRSVWGRKSLFGSGLTCY